jgi:hypothetical protein
LTKWMQKETDRISWPISLISFGFGIKNMQAKKIIGPYYLYVFHPLQQVKAQV